MKLTYNDIRYIISETTKRIITESSTKKITEDYEIDFLETNINPIFDDELDMYEGNTLVNVVCTFEYTPGSENDYDTAPTPDMYRLIEVTPENNEELENSVSPELYSAIIDGINKYVWEHREEFEMDVEDSEEEKRYWNSQPDEDEYRMRKLGY